jgi:hypothetical protein
MRIRMLSLALLLEPTARMWRYHPDDNGRSDQ